MTARIIAFPVVAPLSTTSEAVEDRLGRPVETGGMCRFAGDLDGFASWLRSWGAAERTVTARLTVLGSLGRTLDLASASAEQLGDWLGDPAFSAWTRVTYFSHLRSFYGWQLRAGRRADDPTAVMRRPREPKRKPRPLTADEVIRLLTAADQDEADWLALGLFAGLRVHEIAKIQGEHVTAETLFVRGKGGKDAILPTHPIIREIAERRGSSGYWWPSSRSATGHRQSNAITTRISRLFASCGVEGSIHRARHTYGTKLLRNGVNIRVVQELMRHGSLATTAGYLAVEQEEQRAGIDTLSA